MQKLNDVIIRFFEGQGFVIVASIDEDGFPHTACKGIIKIDPSGQVYLLDVYKAKTYANLKLNNRVSITALDEHKFIGFCLKGKAKLVSKDKVPVDISQAWEDRITSRLTQRLLKNIREEKGNSRHPEVLLPKPEYMIVVKVEEVVDLTPHHLKSPNLSRL